MTRILEIFLAFIRIGALAFGGAYAAMPLIEQEIVDRTGWMTFTEFSDLIAIDELTPGPIIINSATFIGMKLGGIPGAIAATIGSILPACLVQDDPADQRDDELSQEHVCRHDPFYGTEDLPYRRIWQ